MKKVIVLLLLAGFGTYTVSGQDVNDILEKHFAAVGQDKRLEIETIVMKGKLQPPGMEFPVTFYQKRPDKVRSEGIIQGNKFITVYSGGDGWMVNPMAGTSEVIEMQEMDKRQIKGQADIDGMLYNYEDKGYKCFFIGSEVLDGINTYKLSLETKEGDQHIFFINQATYLIEKVLSKFSYKGTIYEVESFMNDYRDVEGVMVAHSLETKFGGNTINKVQIDSIMYNVPVNDALFSRPIAEEKMNKAEEEIEQF